MSAEDSPTGSALTMTDSSSAPDPPLGRSEFWYRVAIAATFIVTAPVGVLFAANHSALSDNAAATAALADSFQQHRLDTQSANGSTSDYRQQVDTRITTLEITLRQHMANDAQLQSQVATQQARIVNLEARLLGERNGRPLGAK